MIGFLFIFITGILLIGIRLPIMVTYRISRYTHIVHILRILHIMFLIKTKLIFLYNLFEYNIHHLQRFKYDFLDLGKNYTITL